MLYLIPYLKNRNIITMIAMHFNNPVTIKTLITYTCQVLYNKGHRRLCAFLGILRKRSFETFYDISILPK